MAWAKPRRDPVGARQAIGRATSAQPSLRRDDGSRNDDIAPSDMVKGMRGLGGRRSVPTNQVKPLMVKDGIRTIKFYPAGGIDNRVKFIEPTAQADEYFARLGQCLQTACTQP